MAVFNPMTLTGAGENLLAQAVAGEGTLSFTAVSTSSTAFSGDPKTTTELQDIMQTVVPSVAVLSGDTIQVSSIFSNDSITQEYTARTVGVYAKINNESPVLFAIAVAADPDTIPAQNPISPSTFYYQFNIAVSDASNVTVSVPEDGSLPASVFYQKLGNTDISQVADGTLTGAINQNTNVIGGDAYDSSKSYAAGDYFIYNNQLCKALTAISTGTSLSEGTNYKTTSLENEIAGLNGKITCHATISDEYSNGGTQPIYVRNGIAIFPVNVSLKNASEFVEFATIEESEALPSGYLIYTLPSADGVNVQYILNSGNHVIRAKCLGASKDVPVQLFHVLMWATA